MDVICEVGMVFVEILIFFFYYDVVIGIWVLDNFLLVVWFWDYFFVDLVVREVFF